MINLDKEISYSRAIFKSMCSLLLVFFVTLSLVWLIVIVRGSAPSEAFEWLFERIDLAIVIFLIAFVCDIPYRIYYVKKQKRRNTNED